MNENTPGFVRCVHPKLGVQYFRESTAKKKNWQASTGWTPQPEPKAAKAVVDNEKMTAKPAPAKTAKTEESKTGKNPKITADSI